MKALSKRSHFNDRAIILSLHWFEIFSGNDDRDTEKTNIINEGLLTRWLRFVAKRSHNKFCMRIELYGVKQKPGKSVLTLK